MKTCAAWCPQLRPSYTQASWSDPGPAASWPGPWRSSPRAAATQASRRGSSRRSRTGCRRRTVDNLEHVGISISSCLSKYPSSSFVFVWSSVGKHKNRGLRPKTTPFWGDLTSVVLNNLTCSAMQSHNLTCQHLVNEDPKRPPVHCLVVTLRKENLAQKYAREIFWNVYQQILHMARDKSESVT